MALLDQFDKLIVRGWSAVVARGEAGTAEDVQRWFVSKDIAVAQHGDNSHATAVRVIGQRMFVLRNSLKQIPE